LRVVVNIVLNEPGAQTVAMDHAEDECCARERRPLGKGAAIAEGIYVAFIGDILPAQGGKPF
jgi:hypothetical protein